MLVQPVMRRRWISSAAQSRSQRVIITTVAPTMIGVFMLPCMPVTWNIGRTPSTTESLVAVPQYTPPLAVHMKVECGCMQPLGLPVVPEV